MAAMRGKWSRASQLDINRVEANHSQALTFMHDANAIEWLSSAPFSFSSIHSPQQTDGNSEASETRARRIYWVHVVVRSIPGTSNSTHVTRRAEEVDLIAEESTVHLQYGKAAGGFVYRARACTCLEIVMGSTISIEGGQCIYLTQFPCE